MRLLIAVRQQEMRAALGFLLSQEADMRVLGEAANSQELLACLEVVRPNVMLLDCELPGLPTADLLAQLYARDANLKVLILCSKVERDRVAPGAGAHTLIDRTSHPRQLVTALHILQLESEYE